MLLLTLTLTSSPQLADWWTALGLALVVVAASVASVAPVGTVGTTTLLFMLTSGLDLRFMLSILFMLFMLSMLTSTGLRVALVRGSNLDLRENY